MFVSHVVAALSAFFWSRRYAGVLKISPQERVRYAKKSVRLALCYAAFGGTWNVHEASRAGKAAFLSCAYDVVTDWHHFNDEGRKSFERVLTEVSNIELQELALALYDKDSNNHLSGDGLERGAIALEFILKTMECHKECATKWGDLTDLGELLQIVDDVLDLEDDLGAGDKNCLLTERRTACLERLLKSLSRQKVHRLFGYSILTSAIAHSRKKATKLLLAAGGYQNLK
jgi:hypothetical protein